MKEKNIAVLNTFIILLVTGLFLSGCEGVGDDTPFSVSTKNITFNAYLNAISGPAPKVVKLTANDSNSERPTVSYPGEIINFVEQRWTEDNIIELHISMRLPSNIGLGDHSEVIHIASSTHSVDVTVHYSITKPPPGDARIDLVAPYVAYTNRSGEVIIRGSGFSNFTMDYPPTVMFGEQQATSVTLSEDSFGLVTDTVLHVTYAALPTGKYHVSIAGDISFKSNVELNVIDHLTQLGVTSKTVSGYKAKMLFDAERKSLYVLMPDSDQIQRYTWSGLSWEGNSATLTGVTDISLSMDGKTLMAAAAGSLYKFDPSAATLTASTPISAASHTLKYIGFDNSNRAIVSAPAVNIVDSRLFLFDIATNALIEGDYLFGHDLPGPVIQCLDGNRVVVMSDNYRSSGYPAPGELVANSAWIYDALSEGVNQVYVTNDRQRPGGTDMTCSKFVYTNASILDSEFQYTSNYLGSLPWTYDAIGMAADGTRAYASDYESILTEIKAFDLTTTSIPQIGVASILFDVGANASMLVSPDGQMIFIAGDNGIMIVPVNSLR